ncbi:hypothetical protein R1flu_015193 [Riccia fluitans]|uniref:Uncharacterized protein n=1 Tax=Riccia fluitans TaxID=41844 RepID=A0ABD1YLC9_9MARC
MRREGKIHGSFVRMRKDDEYFDFRNGTPGKPTNLSKLSSKCPHNSRHCHFCHAGRPWSKAMCKTRGMHKVNDLDITGNYKLDQFTLKCRPSSQDVDDYHGRSAGELNVYSADSDHGDQQETKGQLDDHRSPDMMITIASFLRGMRGARETSVDAGSPDSVSDEETLLHQDENEQNWMTPPELSDDSVSEEDTPNQDERLQNSKGPLDSSDKEMDVVDFDCSWCRVEFSDSEQVVAADVDDWYLVG